MAIPKVGADTSRIYNEDLAATAEYIHPALRENAIDAHPTASIMFGKVGAVMNGAIGDDGAPGNPAQAGSGESIRVQAKLGKNGSARRLSNGYSEFSPDTSDTLRGGRANWKLYGATIIIDGSTKRKNAGSDTRIVDQLMHKQEDSVSALVDLVAQDLLSTSAQPNAITSIPTLIGANDSVQSLSGASFNNWNSRGMQDKGTAAASISFTPSTPSFSAAGISNWRTAYMNAEEGSIKPNAIVTTDSIYRYYEGSLTPQVRYADPRIGDLSFEALRFKGASVFHDPYCPAGTTLFLNTTVIKLMYLPGAFFDITPMLEQESQDAFSAKVIFEGQLITEGRKYTNKITGQTA